MIQTPNCPELRVGVEETGSNEKKIDLIFYSRGNFSANQTSRLVFAFKNSVDKLKVMQILQTRMVPMTCSEARDVLDAFNIGNDRLRVLEHLKRYLRDHQTDTGKHLILTSFPFEGDKVRALNMLDFRRKDVFNETAAGGHMNYGALGTTNSQQKPNKINMYGPIEDQMPSVSAGMRTNLPVTTGFPHCDSIYTGHQEYDYPKQLDYGEQRGYPGNLAYSGDLCPGECPCKPPKPTYAFYDNQRPAPDQYVNPPAPTGFQGYM